MEATVASRQQDPARLARRLSEKAFKRDIKLNREQMELLDEMAAGRQVGRHSYAVLGAIKLKIENAYAKPAQQHELSGNVTITVSCPFPLRGSADPKMLGSGVSEETLEGRQGLIRGRYVETTRDGGDDEPVTVVDLPPGAMTPEQRKAAEREAWLADKAIHPDQGGTR